MKSREFFTPIGPFTSPAKILAVLLSGLFVIQSAAAFAGSGSQQRKTRTGKLRKAGLTDAQQIQQALTKLGFGARAGDAESIGQMGVQVYIDQQLQPGMIDDAELDKRLSKLPTLNLSLPAIAEIYNPPKPAPSPSPSPAPSPSPSPGLSPIVQLQKPESLGQPPGESSQPKPSPQPTASPKPTPPPKNPQQVVVELQRAELLRAVYSKRQLYEAIVNFWENHFSIFSQKDSDRLLLTSFDRDSVRPFAMGRFRDLLGATAHSPAMLYYLDNWQSAVLRKYPASNGKPARTSGGLNENYARELMELHTLGVDGGYTQKDVQEVARCFTGWTIRKPNAEGLAFFNPGTHDNGEKIVLGHKIPAGGGIGDGEMVLDILARHPSTARFIATKLARRFTTDDPPKNVVDRAAAVFLKTDGSITETVREILKSPEFMSRGVFRAKTRSPFEYAAAALRALNAETDADRPILDWINRMGQSSFGRLTPDGYPDTAEQWLSTGTLLVRLNFANALVSNGIKGTQVDLKRLFPDQDLNDTPTVAAKFVHIALADDLADSVRTAVAKIVEGNPPATVAGTKAVFTPPAAQPNPASRAQPAKIVPQTPVVQILTLIVGSPDFQRR